MAAGWHLTLYGSSNSEVVLMSLLDPSPESLAKFHVTMMVVWVLVTPITVIFPQSVLWVALMSQYANFVGHFASYDGARGESEVRAELAELKEMVRRLAVA